MPEPPGSPRPEERLRALEEEVEALTAELDSRRAEADRYRTLVEELPEPVCRFRPDGRLTFVNRAYAELFGRRIEACRGLDLFELVPHSEHGTLRAHFASLTPEGPAGYSEHRVLAPAGEARWVRWSNRAFFDDAGRPVEYQAVGIDVTERRRAEERLRATEARFRAIFERAPVMIDAFAHDRRCRLWNPQCERHLGWTREEVQAAPDPLALFYPDPDERERVMASIRRSDGRFREYRVRAKDGAERIQLWADLRVLDGETLSVGVDVTRRRLAEEELRGSEARLAEAQRIARLGSWEWRIDTDEVEWSAAMHRLFGTDPGIFEPSVESFLERVHPDDRARTKQEIQNTLEGDEPYEVEHRILRPDGSVRHLVSAARLERTEEGRPHRMFGIAQDVTERVAAGRERRELAARVEQAQRLESLGLLAGGIAHDFNNVLMAVMGNVDLARGQLPADSPARGPLQLATSAAQRAAELANQLLAYAGKGRLVLAPLDLGRLVAEARPLLAVCVAKTSELRFLPAPALPAIEGDPAHLRQVLLNLVTNASEAIGDAEGRITVSTGVEEPGTGDPADDPAATHEAEPDDAEAGPRVWLQVTDDGCGMDDETRRRIFDPFFTTKFTGRGLGLAAVLGIVRGHRGTIRVESEPGRGTSVRVLFPVSREPVAEEPRPDAREGRWRGEGLVLLVDDEAPVRQVTGRMLARMGFEVVAAGDGREAVEVFRECAAEVVLVLLDLTMPRMSGGEALAALRAIRADVPVVLSSGYDPRDARGLRADGFLQKPYRLAELEEAVRRALRG